MYKQKIDGLAYSTKFKLAIGGYVAPLFELRQAFSINMTRSAWERGIPGSCTNCGVALAGRSQGVRAIWLGRTVAYILFKIPGEKVEAFFKARVPKATRLAFNANDEEKIDECPTGPIWFNSMKPGTIERRRLREKQRPSRAGLFDGGKKHDSISGTYKPEGIESVASKWRDGTGKVRITEI